LETISETSLMLVVVYAAALIPSILLFTQKRENPFVRVLVVGLVLWSTVPLYHGILSLQGYPTARELPIEFEVVGYYSERPQRGEGNSGAIYLWVVPIEESQELSDMFLWISYRQFSREEPRAFALPFSTDLAGQLEEIAKMMKEGKRVVVRRGSEQELIEADNEKADGEESSTGDSSDSSEGEEGDDETISDGREGEKGDKETGTEMNELKDSHRQGTPLGKFILGGGEFEFFIIEPEEPLPPKR